VFVELSILWCGVRNQTVLMFGMTSVRGADSTVVYGIKRSDVGNVEPRDKMATAKV
jgi:hypothetical protein